MFALTPWVKRSTGLILRTESPFTWMPEEFATQFNRFFPTMPVEETSEWPYTRSLTMEENEKEVIVRAELPGFEPAEVRVELLGDRLTVEAEHREPAEKPEGNAERTYAHVRRVLTLPPGVNVE